MSMSQILDLRQSQRLSMTPQMRQAIRILEMNRVELSDLLEREAAENPLLEVEGHGGDIQIDTLPQQDTDATLERQTATEDQPYELNFALSGADTDYQKEISARPSLRDHLLRQLAASRATPLAHKIATALIGEIDERGYIFAPLFEIALRLSVPVTDVEDGLRLLQSCEPTGIGARSLAECLSLQLAENGHLNSDMDAVLENLNVLQKGGCAQLSKETGLPEERVQTLLGQIRRTNPFPANAFFFDG
ncbi:MAG TPA: hypothetical protein VLA51_03150, partial [Paracoccaceae bacterium]|nr:hypothetical protein [Paracoccaceae bacterium]